MKPYRRIRGLTKIIAGRTWRAIDLIAEETFELKHLQAGTAVTEFNAISTKLSM
jgi:hypothetical protein